MVELLQSQAHILGPTGGRFDGGSRVIVLERPSLEESPMDESLVVRRETQIPAPPATVFAFLTDPQKILSWMGADADTDAHPGGLYLVKDVAGRPGRTARGNSGRSCRSIASPIASAGRETRRCRRDRAWSRSTSSIGTAARWCA